MINGKQNEHLSAIEHSSRHVEKVKLVKQQSTEPQVDSLHSIGRKVREKSSSLQGPLRLQQLLC